GKTEAPARRCDKTYLPIEPEVHSAESLTAVRLSSRTLSPHTSWDQHELLRPTASPSPSAHRARHSSVRERRGPPIGVGAAGFERRKPLPNRLHGRAVELGRDNGVLVRGLRENDAPPVDNRRAAVTRSPRRMNAPLRRGGDKALVLDRTRPEQQLPVILARVEREGCRHSHELGPSEREHPKELGEADVVANRQPHVPARDRAEHGLDSRL